MFLAVAEWTNMPNESSGTFTMTDDLANLKPEELAAWYERLADYVEKQTARSKARCRRSS